MTPKMASSNARTGQLRDARCYPRYRARLPITLFTADGQTATVYSDLISMRGMELSCDKKTALKALGKNQPIPPKAPPAINFSIELPTEPTVTINGILKLLNSRRIAESRYVLGAEYQHLSKTELDLLASFLEEFTPVP